MINTKKAVLLMALLAGTFAAGTIKNRLGQASVQGVKNEGGLGQTEEKKWDKCELPELEIPSIELPECPCVFSELPGLGAGLNTGYSAEAQALQESRLTSVPDTAFSQICQSNCCECQEANHASYSRASKNRTFSIRGEIQVLERLYLNENGQAAENSYGRAEKDTICQRNNNQGGLGQSPECVQVTVCPTLGSVGGQVGALKQ